MVAYIFTRLLGPFAFKLANYSRHSSVRFKNLEEFRNRRYFPSKTANCRFSNIGSTSKTHCTLNNRPINFGVKGAKRSVQMWTTNFYKIFFKNILLYMNGRLSKIRSLHTYAIRLYPGRFILIESVCYDPDGLF